MGTNSHLPSGSIAGMVGSMSLGGNSNSAHKSKANISVSSAGPNAIMNNQKRD